MSRLLVSLPDGFHLHGFVATGLAERLLDAVGEGVTFAVPRGARAALPPALEQRAAWREIERLRLPLASRALFFLRLEASHRLRQADAPARSDWALVRRKHDGHEAWKRALLPLAGLLARLPALDRALAAAERRWVPSPFPPDLDPARFDTVVYGSAGIKALDAALVRRTPRRGPRRYGVVYSWDNLSAKFDHFARFDRLAVWNEPMRRDAVEVLGYPESAVAVVGPVQFDVYAGFAPSRPRSEFLASLGMPADARYLLYAGVPAQTSPWGCEYARCALEARSEAFVLIRPHPQDHAGSYAALASHPRVRVVEPGRPADTGLRRLGFWLPDAEEARSLAEQIHHAEAVVNVASTVTLEALRQSRPVVNVAWDVQPGAFPVAMAEYYATRHYGPVARSGAVPIARSAAELVELLRKVDAWWPGTAAARDALSRSIDPFGDGGAAARLAVDIAAFHQEGAGARA
jgi:hypothetical protein